MKDPRECTTTELFAMLQEQPALFKRLLQWHTTDQAVLEFMDVLVQHYHHILHCTQKSVKQEINHWVGLQPRE